jgi:hypothetical protein
VNISDARNALLFHRSLFEESFDIVVSLSGDYIYATDVFRGLFALNIE